MNRLIASASAMATHLRKFDQANSESTMPVSKADVQAFKTMVQLCVALDSVGEGRGMGNDYAGYGGDRLRKKNGRTHMRTTINTF